MKRTTITKKPDYLLTEGKIISQCPECRAVAIKYDGDKYGPRQQTSMAVFPNAKRKLCGNCIARLEI